MQKREFFNNGQLVLLASVAYECAAPFDGERTNSDEMAVYVTLSDFTCGWTEEQLAVIKFCAEECERQKSGALSVFWMVNAWNNAMDLKHAGERLTDQMVLRLAEMVEPDLRQGWRTTTVTIRGVVAGSSPAHVHSDMTELGLMLDAYAAGEPAALRPAAHGAVALRAIRRHPPAGGWQRAPRQDHLQLAVGHAGRPAASQGTRPVQHVRSAHWAICSAKRKLRSAYRPGVSRRFDAIPQPLG